MPNGMSNGPSLGPPCSEANTSESSASGDGGDCQGGPKGMWGHVDIWEVVPFSLVTLVVPLTSLLLLRS